MSKVQLGNVGLTLLALLAFAANSILCRLALSVELVPPLDFTIIRIMSAALTLWLILLFRNKIQLNKIIQYGSTTAAAYLLVYLAGFSFAYLKLGTASGALLLFAAVQFTMLLAYRLSGQHLGTAESTGVMISLLGFLYFVYPQLNTPDAISCLSMICAGIAWGLYSLVGARSVAPLEDTASNFIRLVPLALVGLSIICIHAEFDYSLRGVTYTLLSGSLASGLGYALWYLVLPKLASSLAAVCQLSVPIWAALGGLWIVDEVLTKHLLLSSFLVLGGIALVIASRFNRAK